MYIINFIRGFFMAMADSVPGVSGGTIAFILGFYDDFIFSIDTLIYNKDFKEKFKAFQFLIKIGMGWIVGFILSILVIANVFESNIYAISSLFIGFIVVSIPILIREELEILKEKKISVLFIFIGIFVVYFISSSNITANLIQEQGSSSYYLFYFLAGMIAISAMVLPGISGSTILLILGLYAPIIYAIESFLKLDFTYFFDLLSFGFGILAGLVVTVKILSFCLKKYRAQMIYLVIGLMIGSIYAVVVGPTTLDTPMANLSFETFSILFFAIGALIIFLLENFKIK